MPDKFPGAKSLLATAIPNTDGGQPAARLPTLGSLSTAVGVQLSGRARSGLMNLPQRLVGNSRLGQTLGPFLESQLGNLLSTPLEGPLREIMSRPDPMMAFQWNVVLPPMTKAAEGVRSRLPGSSNFFSRAASLFFNTGTTRVASVDEAIGHISSYVEDITVPAPSIEAVAVYRAGKRIYIPSVQDVGGFNMIFYEDQLGTASRYLELWKLLIRSNEGFFTPRSVYAKDIVVRVLDNRGNVFGKLTLVNAWPTQRDPITLSSGTSDIVRITQAFSVDDVIFQYPPLD